MSPLDQITQDLNWRESELGSLKILLTRRDLSSTQREVLLRAAWAMLYAHYEGFVKFSLTVFYEEAEKRIDRCDQLPKETRVMALGNTLKKLKSLPAIDLLDEIENFEITYNHKTPSFPDVNTGSNLWPNILEELLKSANLKDTVVKEHRYQLRTLVSRRNDIAHGKQDIIPEVEYYFGFENAVYQVMYNLAFVIDERLKSSPYSV